MHSDVFKDKTHHLIMFLAHVISYMGYLCVQYLITTSDVAYRRTDKSTYWIEREILTAFCPSTVHKIPSDAFARHARIIYVGSMYFTSAVLPISLKYFFV